MRQLVDSGNYTREEVECSEYFSTHYKRDENDPSILSLDLGPGATREMLDDSMRDSLRPNHFNESEKDLDRLVE